MKPKLEDIQNHLNNLKQIFPKLITPQYIEFIDNSISADVDIKEKIFLVKNNLCEIPKCEYENCNNDKSFLSMTKGYNSGCCKDHSTKVTNIKKYGCENPMQSSKVKEKSKHTSLEKYGYDNPAKSQIIKEKQQATYFKKTGFKSPLENPEIQEKIKLTNFEKYGVSNPMSVVEIAEKFKSTMIERYGVATPMQSDEIKKKSRSKMMSIHGVSHFNKSDKFRKKCRYEYYTKKILSAHYPVKPLFSIEDYCDLTPFKQLPWECKTCNSVFVAHNENKVIPRCFDCCPCIKVGVSQKEKELVAFLECSIGVYVEKQNRNILQNSFELDIYIPSKKIAIEFNGIYWHSELNGKDKNYHLNKTTQCQEKGIQLIHVFESEWLEKQEIVKSIIAAKLGKFKTRLFARNCAVREIDNDIKNSFLNENHSQGEDKSTINIGLFYNDELVSVMTFGNSRYNKKYEYEMHRFCTKIGYQIIGGAGKLWSYFVKTYNPKSVITYADRRYSDGTFYEKIGFKKIGISKPNYFYFKSASMLLSRLKFQKHKLKNILESFNPELTEWDNMQLNGYDRIWDCGNYVFVWKNS